MKDVLSTVTDQPLPSESHLRFQYEVKASALARYVGKSGRQLNAIAIVQMRSLLTSTSMKRLAAPEKKKP